MQLSVRLETILAMAGEGERAADIGTDHGYVPIELVRRGLYHSALAMDVRRGPLERAQEHIRLAGLGDRIQTRLSNGMENMIPGEADTVIIAGMGGPLMRDILDHDPEVAHSVSALVLSPQTEVEQFRRYLHENFYKVEDEVWIEDENKYYVVMKARWKKGEVPEEWREIEYAFGKIPLERSSPVLIRYLQKEIRTAEGVLSHLESLAGDSASLRRGEMQKRLQLAREALSEVTRR